MTAYDHRVLSHPDAADIERTPGASQRPGISIDHDVSDIVVGLHWDPSTGSKSIAPANLDAVCVLLDADDGVVELVYPGRLSNANGSVLHTGDSRTGASVWDDERIFVFLRALPDNVVSLTFGVISVDGLPFSAIAGASCHVTDHSTDTELVKFELTGTMTQCAAATLRRGATGWSIHPGTPPGPTLRALLAHAGSPYTGCVGETPAESATIHGTRHISESSGPV